MKKRIVLLLILNLGFTLAFSQKGDHSLEINDIGYFNKISIGPHVNLHFIQGDEENVKIDYRRIDEEDIHVKLVGKTLKIYLDKSKNLPKKVKIYNGRYKEKVSVYDRSRVTAYVTVQDLKKIESKGEEYIYSDQPLVVDKLKIKSYGSSDIRLSSLKADRFKAVLWGDHNLRIKDGIVKKQVLKGIGDNDIQNEDLISNITKVGVLGDTQVDVNAKDYLRLSSLGESVVKYSGLPRINRWFTIGENNMYRVR
ncbi:MAG: DUF2807 domain-containing protein [Bacteroidota bacterium]